MSAVFENAIIILSLETNNAKQFWRRHANLGKWIMRAHIQLIHLRLKLVERVNFRRGNGYFNSLPQRNPN